MALIDVGVTKTVGCKYGHVPGHEYHDVTVTIQRRKSGRWRVAIVERWGSAQGGGCDEELGCKEVVGCSGSMHEAAEEARCYARDAGIHLEYLVQAFSAALDAADEAYESAEEV